LGALWNVSWCGRGLEGLQLMRKSLGRLLRQGKSMVRLLGFGLFAAGAACGIVAWYLDRQLQAFRLSEKPRSAYSLVPIRIRRELYRPEAAHLVDRAWQFIAAMYGLAFLGMLLIGLGS
jgi:hypothetical protein